MSKPSFPVFYDHSGKRLRRLVVLVFLLMLIVVASVVSAAPSVLGSLHAATNSDADFVRRFLATGDQYNVAVLGDKDNVLTRMVRVDRDGDTWRLVDPATNEHYRDATAEERNEIGDSPYAVDHFARPPDKTLILTFDDGPDPTYTPQILDILSRNGVPAVFFVVGEQVVTNPDLLRRIVREGHMVANHTMTHLDFDHEGDWRNREEIIATDHVIRATAGYETRLFRMPKGDPDNNPVALLQGQQLGQIHIDFDLDTRDWEYPLGAEIPVPTLDGRGHVVLLHDGGNDRSATVAMLERFIVEAKAQGYTFTTLTPILPPQYVPQKISPSFGDQTTLLSLQAVWIAPGRLFGLLFWAGTGSLVIVSVLYLFLAVLNERRARRRQWPDYPDEKLPFVSVVLAAYNEEKVIARTLDTLRESDYPQSRFEVVAVNDGSKDRTLEILYEYALRYPQLRVVNQENSGKSSAVNNGINHADPRSTVIVSMDADTLFRSDTIRMLARHFVGNRHGKKRVGAVAGHVKVGNRRNLITAWQSLEYISGICVTRMAEQTLGAVGIVPGACSAWDRRALERIGGFCEDTLAEDADATLELQKLGYAVVNENAAICDTEAPETVVALAKQRKRWTFGNVQVLWKHKSMFFRPKYGALGMLTMPYAALSLIVPIIFMPVTVVVAGLSLATGNWEAILLFAGFVALVHLIIAATGVAIARESVWHLLVVLYYRVVYEPLRAYLLYASAWRAIKGTVVAWDKLERRNSVVAVSS